ncbi:hypothetical protein Dimus_037824 [Dionaea muscipula]
MQASHFVLCDVFFHEKPSVKITRSKLGEKLIKALEVTSTALLFPFISALCSSSPLLLFPFSDSPSSLHSSEASSS